jgi:hypothetical protein
MAEIEVRVSGLNKVDQLELEGELGVRFEEMAVPAGSHGELTLITAYFAMSALTALAAYLLRSTEDELVEEDVDIVHPDGRRETRHVKVHRKKSEAPAADIIKQIRGPL